MTETWGRRRRAAATWTAGSLALLLLPGVLLADFTSAGFVADDFYFTSQTFDTAPAALLLADWGHSPGDAARYRPLVTLTYAASQVLDFGPAGYRLTNYALHGLASMLVAVVIGRLSGSAGLGLAGGALFAVHPVHHDNVLWISGRTHLVAAVFYLTCVLAWWHGRNQGRKRTWTLVTVALAVASVASYETAVSLPLLVAVLAALYPRDGHRRWSGAVVEAAPLAVVVVGYLLFRELVLDSDDSAVVSGTPLLTARLLVSRLLACGYCELGRQPFSSMTLLITGVGVAVSAALAWRHGSGRRLLAAGLAWIVVAYLPFLGVPGYADRFVYLASVGLVLVIVAGGLDLMRRPLILRAPAIALIVLVFMLWSRQLRMYGEDWRAAGDIARTLVEQIVRLVPNPPAGAHMHVDDIPLHYQGAGVFITSFDIALREAYARPDLQVTVTTAATDESAESDRRAADVVLRWDAATRTIVKSAVVSQF